MVCPNQFLAVVGAALVVLHLSTAPGRTADSGHPPDLINQPVCWSAEEPDPSRHCDFALRV